MTAPAGPFESGGDASGSPAVQAVYAAMRSGDKMADASAMVILEACAQAGVTLGTYDVQVIRWVAGLAPEAAAVIAGVVGRAAARPPRAVVIGLGDEGADACFVLTTALADFTERQLALIGQEGGNPSRERWAAKAGEIARDVEAAMGGLQVKPRGPAAEGGQG